MLNKLLAIRYRRVNRQLLNYNSTIRKILMLTSICISAEKTGCANVDNCDVAPMLQGAMINLSMLIKVDLTLC